MDKDKTAIQKFFERFDETGIKKTKGRINEDKKIKEETKDEAATSSPQKLFREKRERFGL